MKKPVVSTISLCGTPVRAENVRLLAKMFRGEELADKLRRAVTNGNTIVALSMEERQQIVDALGSRPAALAELRSSLSAQLQRHRDRQVSDQRMRASQREVESRQATRQAAAEAARSTTTAET